MLQVSRGEGSMERVGAWGSVVGVYMQCSTLSRRSAPTRRSVVERKWIRDKGKETYERYM